MTQGGGRLLVTGSTGFIGRALCAHLKGRHRDFREALRSQRPQGDADTVGDRVVVGELSGATDWQPALAGISHVVHLAGLAHVMGASGSAAARFRMVNTEATARLAQQAAAAGVGRFVYVSSVKAVADASATPLTEETPARPCDAYGISKLDAETALREVAAGSAMEVVVLRPPLVYGPAVGANFLRLLRLVDRGLPLPLGAVRNRRSLIYVANLVDAMMCCLDAPAAANQVFFVSDGEGLSTPQLIRAIAAALGRRPRLLPVPLPLLRAAAGLFGARDQVARLTESLEVDSGKIRRLLDWAPPVSVPQGLEETVAWYRGVGD